ncbi:hypothetical protein [Streptomyces sp. AP-93]|uniref:hypothetical protein n=1 Tax=Streptomyces sp. AP-93 TaxID=2929048 RepID=UPI001FAEC0EF|nr:hypothetical protein [Streptomyces sp. AP-93]MCJ0868083.1 hypothetical protein [Streptomyces sp. AP-93]
MNEPLPHRTPLARQLEDQPDEGIPWDAFAVESDVAGVYGQPSPALMARAKRGWRNLGYLHAGIDPVDADSTAEGGPA